MAMEIGKKALRRQPLYPKFAAVNLQVPKILRREFMVKLINLFRNAGNLTAVNPDTKLFPVDGEIIGQDAIRIDKDRDPATVERLIKPIREIATAADAQDVIAGHQVVHKFLADLLYH